MKKQHVQPSPADRDYLETLMRQGEQTAKAYCRALALPELDCGKTYTEVSKKLRATIPTVSGWAANYLRFHNYSSKIVRLCCSIVITTFPLGCTFSKYQKASAVLLNG